MSIYKTNVNLPNADRISLINDMIIELKGLVSKGQFDANETAQIYADISLDNKYLRSVSLGNTLSTYGDWTHVKAEDGYGIWKITPSNYTYNVENDVYFDDKLLDARGQADSETATAFDCVYLYNGDSGSGYVDNTAEAATEGGTAFEVMDSTNDYLYFGEAATFAAVKFEWGTRGSYYTLVVEYYNGDSGGGWTTMTADLNDLDDDTSNFESDGRISWTVPDDWGTVAVNSQTKYWIRISTSTTPVTTGTCNYLIPGNSVIGKLAMSPTQIMAEEWAWCSYNDDIYVTIRNVGNASYEGNYHITSTSSTVKKQNFFIYNHTYSSDYEDSTYNPAWGAGVAWGGITGTLSAQTDLQAALDLKANLASPTFTGTVTVAALSLNSAYTFPTSTGNVGQVLALQSGASALDWEDIAGGGDVSKVGTPVDNQVGVWTGNGTIEGTTGLTYDGSDLNITGNITLSGTVDGIDIATDVAANTLKNTNVSTNLSLGAVDATTMVIESSDGTNVTLIAATTDDAGLLTAALFDEIDANTAKVTNATHSGDVTGSTELTIAAGAVDIAMLSATGTPSDSTFLRGDNTWNTPAGGGDVSKVGTPVNSQVGVWTGDGTIEGAASLTYDGSNLQLTGDIGSTGTKITKGWFTDLTVTNAIAGSVTGSAATVTGFTPASGSLTLSGADALTLTTTASTNVTLPTSGTLATLAQTKNEVLGFAVSDETTDLEVADDVLTFRMPFAMTLTGVRASVTTAPTGSTIIVDIEESGSTIFSTLLSIDATEKTSTTATSAAVISDSALADDAEISINIDQIGSSVAGAGLKIWLIGTRA